MKVKPLRQRKIKLWCNYTPCENRATARLNTSGGMFGAGFFAMEIPTGWVAWAPPDDWWGRVGIIVFYCPEHNTEDMRKQ
jgi:hypothetical protein